MKKSYNSFKDIQRFKEIAEILNISFEEAEGFFRLINEKKPEERHREMIYDENMGLD